MAVGYEEKRYKRPLLLTEADFLSFSLDVQKNPFCDEILINPSNSETDDELKITLVIDMSPQPFSPDVPFIYTPTDKETGKRKYDSSIILGCNAVGRIFCSHEEYFDKIDVKIHASNFAQPVLKKVIRDYKVLEKLSFESDEDRYSSFQTYGFIKGGNHNNTASETFGISGSYFSYETDIIAILFPQCEGENAIYEIEITCEEQKIKLRHAFAPQGFYPDVWHESVSYIEELNVEPNKLTGYLYKELEFRHYNHTQTLEACGKKITYTLTPLALEKKQEGLDKK